MGHDTTWLQYLPGYQNIQEYLRMQAERVGNTHGLLGNAITVQHVLAAAVVVIVALLLGLKARVDLARAQDGGLVPPAGISVRNLIEVALEALYGQMKQIIGKDTARYFPVIAALTVFIFISNLLGLIPGFAPPTANWNTTFGCSIFVFLYYNFHGIRAHGLGHLGHMANPIGTWWGWFLAPLMFPIEVVSHFGRPFSLAVRLAANMAGDHAVITAFLGLIPILVPLPFMALGLIVCFVQTLVFVMLSTIYIGLATAEEHAHDEHPNVAAATPAG